MTVNFQRNRNHLRIAGDIVFGAYFGDVCSIVPVCIKGAGHQPYVHVGFRSGLSLELTPETATELARRLPEALASLPTFPDVSGSVWGGEQ